MKISGIYQIQSKIKPERIYIGSAININSRWNMHLFRLRKKEHHSIKLQNHYNKYRESDLQFSVLLGCDKGDLIKIEQYFIDSYNPWFNIAKKAGSALGIRRIYKKTPNCSRAGGKNGQSKIVLNTETGIYYDYVKEASDTINMKRSTLEAMLRGENRNKTKFIYIN
jgi:group I intron endonuclease